MSMSVITDVVGAPRMRSRTRSPKKTSLLVFVSALFALMSARVWVEELPRHPMIEQVVEILREEEGIEPDTEAVVDVLNKISEEQSSRNLLDESDEFMTEFYRRWFDPDRHDHPAEALRATQLAWIRSEDERERDPKYWAPYVLVERR